MGEPLFDKRTIERALTAVAARLEVAGAEPAVLIVVGGSFMAVHELRASTRDVDSMTRLTDAVREAVAAVAAELGFEPDWLNDRSAAYLPLGLREDLCEVVLDHPHLRVLGPPVDFVFVMKLYAGRAVDHDDLVALWPHCSFSSPVDAVAFYWNAYPHAPTDEHLASYVEQIAEEAGR